MKIGDLIINPSVSRYFKGKPNPMYKTMVVYIGSPYTKALAHNGEMVTWYTHDAKNWEVAGNVNLKQIILNGYCEVE